MNSELGTDSGRFRAEEIVPELAEMRVGESLLIECQPGTSLAQQMAVSVAVYGLRAGRRFAQQFEGDDLKVGRVG